MTVTLSPDAPVRVMARVWRLMAVIRALSVADSESGTTLVSVGWACAAAGAHGRGEHGYCCAREKGGGSREGTVQAHRGVVPEIVVNEAHGTTFREDSLCRSGNGHWRAQSLERPGPGEESHADLPTGYRKEQAKRIDQPQIPHRIGRRLEPVNRCPLKAGAHLAREMEKTMPKDSHSEAAEHHERAAKSHRTAAEHHGRGEHEKGHAASSEAHGHSGRAHESSSRAHAESGEHNKKR